MTADERMSNFEQDIREIATIYIKRALLGATVKYRDLFLDYRQRYGTVHMFDHINEMMDELLVSLDDDTAELLKKLEFIGGIL